MEPTTPDAVFDRFPALSTERLHLVEIKQQHRGDLFQIFSNPEVTRYYNVVLLTEEEEAQKFIDYFSSRFAQRAAIRWGIAIKGNDGIIGTIGINNYTKDHRANIGYDLLPQYWNKGYMTEALGAVLHFGFRRLEINRMEAEVMQGNIASERLLRKLGFSKEGILREWMYWNGKHYDMSMFSLLRSDYEAKSHNEK